MVECLKSIMVIENLIFKQALNILEREMYHTQEKRENRLYSPMKCIHNDAWLGDGYYFWENIIDAKNWGYSFKRKTGEFEVYSADLNFENFLDTVFNRIHYEFWIMQIEKAAKKIRELTGIKPTLKELNAYFKHKAPWTEVDGILFQDIPKHNSYVEVTGFWYKKRIQAVVFNTEIISNFEIHLVVDCNQKN